jgi:serine/threonine protein kinase
MAHLPTILKQTRLDSSNEPCISDFDKCYKLERKLMSGSYGTVYVGVDVSTKMRYAVKVVDRRSVRIL